MTKTTNRRIQAYFVEPLAYDEARNRLFDIPDLIRPLTTIAALSTNYDDTPNRYLELEDTNELFAVLEDAPEESGTGPVYGQFAIKRRSKLPMIEDAGAYSAVALAASQGLAEIRHFGYWPDSKVLLIEFNFFAPRISRFAEYLERQNDPADLALVKFVPIMLEDSFEKLNDMTRIAAASISVVRSDIDVVKELDDNLFRGLRAIRSSAPNAQEVELRFELRNRKREASLDVPWLSGVQEFFAGDADRSSAIRKLKVRGHDEAAGRSREVDLLEGRFEAFRRVAVLDERTQAVTPASMFQALASAYEELSAKLPN